MTVYVHPLWRNPRRRMLDEIAREWDHDHRSALTFPIDVRADSDSFTIQALLPGVKAVDLDIQIINETVAIAGEMHVNRAEGADYLLTERPDGRFHRILTLPAQLDQEKVEARLEDGVLTIHIPKAEEAMPRTIKVRAK